MKNYWNTIYKNLNDVKPTYDLWLDKYKYILDKNRDTTIIDLGCGSGGDTLYLSERNYKVLSCDYSKEALNLVNKFIANATIMYHDLTERLPFENESTSIIIADLSIHYFNDAMTNDIINEIRRVLKPNGYLIGRVNSVKDINYGVLTGKEIEKNYYLTKDGYKRFFDEDDIKYYFKDFKIKHYSEESMNRYGNEKVTWEFMVQRY